MSVNFYMIEYWDFIVCIPFNTVPNFWLTIFIKKTLNRVYIVPFRETASVTSVVEFEGAKVTCCRISPIILCGDFILFIWFWLWAYKIRADVCVKRHTNLQNLISHIQFLQLAIEVSIKSNQIHTNRIFLPHEIKVKIKILSIQFPLAPQLRSH